MDGDRIKRISLDSGAGLLDARAIWAAIVGPQRLAMSQRTSVRLSSTETREVFKSLGAANAYVLVGVGLPFNAPVNPLQVVFGKDDQLGSNTGLPIRLTDSVVSFSFTQLLLPGEQLYAQIMDIAVAEQNIIVASAMF